MQIEINPSELDLIIEALQYATVHYGGSSVGDMCDLQDRLVSIREIPEEV